MKRRTFTALSTLGTLTLATLLATPVGAQDRPALTMIVPTTTATAGDIIARLISPHLSDKLKRNVVVENRTGASGIIGMQAVVRAAPNGNTVLVSPNSLLTISGLNQNLPFNVKTDLVPVTPLAVSTMAVFASPAFAAKNVNDIVQIAKRDPGKINYGSPGIGTPHHLLMEVFREEQGINLTHIPFKGTAGMVTDMAGNRVDVAFMPVHASVELAKAGKVRILAVLSEKRSPLFPDVPTITEQGYRAERFTWTAGIFVPVGTSPAFVRELETAVMDTLKLPAIESALAKAGLTPVIEGSQDFTRRYNTEVDKWRGVVEKAGIKPQ